MKKEISPAQHAGDISFGIRIFVLKPSRINILHAQFSISCWNI